MTHLPCPCGSLQNYSLCCERYIAGGLLAPDPESLMRSRYTAFYRHDLAYLQKTWNPETFPEDLGAEPASLWVRLEILDSWSEDDEGEVEFKASFIHDNRLEMIHELSFFDRIDGQWLYYSGEFQNDGQRGKKIALDESCPCGSGRSFQDCHYVA